METKECRECFEVKPLDNFSYIGMDSKGKPKYKNTCKKCIQDKVQDNKRNWSEEKLKAYYDRRRKTRLKFKTNNPVLAILAKAKKRAKRMGLEFNLEPSDIIVPEFCPIFKTPLKFTPGQSWTQHTPSLDRVNSSKGYIKGNVAVISMRANTLKSNMTLEEITRLYQYTLKYHGKQK